MTVESFCRHLSRILDAADGADPLELAAREIAAYFALQPHEVAFFKIDSAGRTATLRWPSSDTVAANAIPLKAFTTSLLAATVREKKGSIDNAFSKTRHLHMVEHSLADREQRLPVHKIMSAPFIRNGSIQWVLQVSRKGKTPEEAGIDFTETDLQNLLYIAQTTALPNL